MKHLFISLTLLFSSVLLYGQNVGIGTNTPSQKLDVDGAIKVGTTATADTGTIRFNPGTLTFEGYDGAQWKNLQAGDYWIKQGDSLYTITIPFVGIGTANPSANLDVVGSLQFDDGNQGKAKILVSDSLGNAQWKKFSVDELVGGLDTTPDYSCLGVLGSVSVYGTPNALTANGPYANYAYYVSSSGVGVVNITDPANPTTSGIIGFTNATAFSMNGNAFYAIGSGVLRTYLATSGGNLNPYVSLSLGITSNAISHQGPFAYVVGSSYLRVVNVSSISNPFNLGYLYIPSSNLVSVVARGAYCYALDNNSNQIRVINISDPNNPTLQTSRPLTFAPQDIAVKGNYAYIVGGGTLQAVSLSNPTNPALLGSVSTNGMSISIDGNYAFVTTNTNGSKVEVFSLSNPSFPVLVRSVAIGTGPYDIDVKGDYAYIIDRSTGHFRVLELTCKSKVLTVDNATGTLSLQSLNSQGAAVGPVGPQGIQGPVGPQGVQGITGPVGPTGPTGVSITNTSVINDSLVITLSNSSTINAGYVTGPQGNTGPQGPVGPAINANGTLNYLSKFDTAGTILGNSTVIETGGNVGIGIATPTYKLHVNGTIGGLGGSDLAPYLHNVHSVGLLQHYDGNYGYQGDPHHQVVLGDNGAWNSNYRRLFLKRPGWAYTNEIIVAYADGFTSARKLKQNIVSVETAEYDSIFQALLNIDIVRYEFINDPNHIEGRKYIGLIADDVPEELQMPDAQGIETGDMFAYVIVALKTLAKQNEQQEDEITTLQTQIDELKNELEAIKVLLRNK